MRALEVPSHYRARDTGFDVTGQDPDEDPTVRVILNAFLELTWLDIHLRKVALCSLQDTRVHRSTLENEEEAHE